MDWSVYVIIIIFYVGIDAFLWVNAINVSSSDIDYFGRWDFGDNFFCSEFGAIRRGKIYYLNYWNLV